MSSYINDLESALKEVTPSYNPYGKEGTFARAENLYNSGGTLDDKTIKELNAYADNRAGQFDEETAHKAALELLKWGLLKEAKAGVVPINGSSYSGAQSAYNAQLKAIEEQRTYAEKLAEQARQDAIKNAYVTYDRSLPTYGQNAERLANMGLSNSGYSDYLGGVAYSSMVGGIQDAHKTADKAIQDAYYNAELQKAQAADTLYNRQVAESQIAYDRQSQEEQMKLQQDQMKLQQNQIDADAKAAAEQAYKDVVSKAILSAGSGTNLETVLAYAQANGVTNEADLQLIKDAYSAYSNIQTVDFEKAAKFEEILFNAIYGDYTVEQVQALAKLYKFDETELNVLIKAVENSKDIVLDLFGETETIE